jgi:AcrR family transcriptional regulator
MRLTSQARRASIIGAARQLFAEKGFHGTTTRALAAEAGVSEALLYKHFQTKEVLYEAMLDDCRSSEIGREYERFLTLPPSSSSLVALLHFLLSTAILGNKQIRDIHRLMLRSLSEDASYARVILQSAEQEMIPALHRLVLAALKEGDLRPSATRLKNGEWLAQHLLLMLAFMSLPEEPPISYKLGRECMIQEAVVFCLRGLGMKDRSIERLYNPRALGLMSGQR